MKLETKFNIGDEVFFVKDNRVTSSKVTAVKIEVNQKLGFVTEIVTYGLECDRHNGQYEQDHLEDLLFPTKQSLLDSL